MADLDATPLPAGDFTTWLGMIGSAIDAGTTSDVPCGTCTGCCTASQFVHIGADETDCLAHIPGALLFAAPGLPAGNVLLGFDENGRCPMLVDTACSIYDYRPRTCRAYDCRVFAATGIEADKPTIAATASRWRFEYSDDAARARQQEIREIASRDNLRISATQRAVIALRG